MNCKREGLPAEGSSESPKEDDDAPVLGPQTLEGHVLNEGTEVRDKLITSF